VRLDLAAGHIAARGPTTGLNGFPIPRRSPQPQENSGTSRRKPKRSAPRSGSIRSRYGHCRTTIYALALLTIGQVLYARDSGVTRIRVDTGTR